MSLLTQILECPLSVHLIREIWRVDGGREQDKKLLKMVKPSIEDRWKTEGKQYTEQSRGVHCVAQMFCCCCWWAELVCSPRPKWCKEEQNLLQKIKLRQWTTEGLQLLVLFSTLQAHIAIAHDLWCGVLAKGWKIHHSCTSYSLLLLLKIIHLFSLSWWLCGVCIDDRYCVVPC